MNRLLWACEPSFGAFLVRARCAVNLSGRAAAKRLGCSHTFLQRIETVPFRTPPGLELLKQVATVYKLNLDDVLAEAGYRPVPLEVPSVVASPPPSMHFKAIAAWLASLPGAGWHAPEDQAVTARRTAYAQQRAAYPSLLWPPLQVVMAVTESEIDDWDGRSKLENPLTGATCA